MTIDLKLAYVCFGAAALALFWAFVLTILRWAVFHIAAKATHMFYVSATGTQPTCATCPFNRKCPYSDGKTCHFSDH